MPLARPIPAPLIELIAQRLQVLGQPLRIRLVERLDRAGEASVRALADELGVTPYNASQHLGVLRQAGVVTRRQRGRQALYRLADSSAVPVYELVAERLGERASSLERGMGGSPGA